jgi:transcriptional regulator with XRE-family HTH domain
MTTVSRQFLIRLKLHELPAYKIAQQAGVNPNTLSRLINGIDRVKPKDPRILAVGEIMGLSESQCFEESEVKSSS